MKVYLPELVVPGKRLGRHVEHDQRSLQYLLPEAETVTSVAWERHIPILDQREVGSCTGNAMVGALGTGPLYDALKADAQAADFLDDLGEADAVEIYSEAEKLDGGAGMPTEDQGSSGLSVAKAAKNDGYISGYQHAVTLAAAHTAIQAGPFLLGCYWWSDMDQPTSEGIVTAGGTIRGGHETECDEYDATRDLWWICNSWTTQWGLNGKYAVDSPTLIKLLAGQGDITVPVPVSAPAPNPTPAPPSPAVSSLTWDNPNALATLRTWANAKHTGSNRKAAAAFREGH